MPEEYISPYRQKLNKKKERAWKALAYHIYSETEKRPLEPQDWEPEGEFAVYMQRAQQIIKVLKSAPMQQEITKAVYGADGNQAPFEEAIEPVQIEYALAVHAVIDRLMSIAYL